MPDETPLSPTPADPNKPKVENADETKKGSVSDAKSNWQVWHTLSLLGLLVVFGAVCWYQPPLVSFLVGLASLTLFLVIAGHGVVGEWLGGLIDERNRMSMSRLQTALWTVVVLSGFLAAAVWNVRLPENAPPAPPANNPEAKNAKLGIGVPQELWWVLGISVTSLAGTPLIRSSLAKKDDTQTKKEGGQVSAAWANQENVLKQQSGGGEAYTVGRIACFSSPANARLADLFQGEQKADATHLDLGKVQVFFFTALLVFAYVVMLAEEFSKAANGGPYSIPHFPALDKGIVTLLGISHAGYLANKAVDKGPVQ